MGFSCNPLNNLNSNHSQGCFENDGQQFPGSSVVKNLLANAGDAGFLGWDDPLEEEMSTHSSILVWVILWTEKPDVLQSMESQRVKHNLVTKQPQNQSSGVIKVASTHEICILHILFA